MLIDGQTLIVSKERKWAYIKHKLHAKGFYTHNLDSLKYRIRTRLYGFYSVTREFTGSYNDSYSIIINTALQIPTYKRHEL